MKATNWEFANRATIFGIILGCSFSLYVLDKQNITVGLANWTEARWHTNAEAIARILFAIAALLLCFAALIRTWASAYLHAGVVYAAQVRSASLVADGPYRFVRNPLYFANVLMAIAFGSMMSRAGFVAVTVATAVFCYRLIVREESELQANQGESYEDYRKAVPRLWPSPWPRIAASGRAAKWGDGFKAESWYWGFALALVAFAVTLKLPLFFAILTASLALFWILASAMEKKARMAGNASTDEKQ
jgi:protein-S-isoprenylcysteine O-methyltransferase Ste14